MGDCCNGTDCKDKFKSERNINQYLSNIKIAKNKIFQLFSYLNSDIFKEVQFKDISLSTTPVKSFDEKIYIVKINAEIVNKRPEAILEAQNIDSELKSVEFISTGKINYDRYLSDRLPIQISFAL